MPHHPRFGAGLRTWFAYALVAAAAGSVAACTALLGSFEIEDRGSTSSLGDSGLEEGGEAPGGTEGPGITPETVKMGVERPFAFNAGGPVTWSVLEGEAGGRIDETGHYVSPKTEGTYHVVATSTADPSLKSQATVTVVGLQLEVVAGPAAGQGTVDGLAAVAHFNRPEAIAFADARSAGEVQRYFIADTGSHTIRRVAGGMVSTLAGRPGAAGNQDGLGAVARFSRPRGIAFAPTIAKVLVSDTENHCIRAVDPETGATEQFAGLCGERGNDDGDAATQRLDSPGPILLSTNEARLFICPSSFGAAMRVLDMSTKTMSTFIDAPDWATGCALGVNEFGGGGFNRVFFGGQGDGLLRSFDATVSPVTVATHSTLPAGHVDGLASDTGSGGGKSIYAAVGQNHAIYWASFDLGGVLGPFELFAGDPAQTNDVARNGTMAEARFGKPMAMLHGDGSGRLIVVDEAASAVRNVEAEQNRVTDLFGKSVQYGHADQPRSAARFALVTGVTIGPDFAYVSDASSDGGRISGTIRAVNLSTGAVSTVAGQIGRHAAAEDGPKATAKFVFPFDLVKEGEFLYVVDALAHAVRKVAIVDGQVTTIAGSLNAPGDSVGTGIAAQLRTPAGIAADGQGNLYVSDAGNFKIKKIALATNAVTVLAGSTEGGADGPGLSAQFRSPAGLAVIGDSLFVADSSDHTIRQIKLATGEVTTLIGQHGAPGLEEGGPAIAKLFGPVRLAPDGTGGLYVTEGVPGFELDKCFLGTTRRIDVGARTIRSYFGKPQETGLVPGPLANARANCPFGLATTPSGDLVFTDLNDYSVGFIKPL